MNYACDITILCRVVDNYGDIGFAYRLSRALLHIQPHSSIRIIVDDLHAFSLLAPGIDERAPVQQYDAFLVYDWNAADACTKSFSQKQPRTILQCFQCGYPTWLETLLFEKKFPDVVHVVNIDYLTAEPYAQEFHCLASLTRSARVQKVNFMPGFTANTGGLLLDGVTDKRTAPDGEHASNSMREFSVLVFTYERDCMPLVRALSQFEKLHEAFCKQHNCAQPRQTVHAYVAAGGAQQSFVHAWQNTGKQFSLTQAAFLPQREWDALLFSMSALFVRGEDSLSRACLSGIPFVWHAYRQENDYQKVKVRALLKTMRPFFSREDFALLEMLWLSFNTSEKTHSESCDTAAARNNTQHDDTIHDLTAQHACASCDLTSLIVQFLERSEHMRASFEAFAASLCANGDFAQHLLDFLATLG